MRITRTSARKVTLITYIPKLTLFVLFGILERNIPVKQTGEVQQLCVQSCVRVLKNTKVMEIILTIALTPRMTLTKGIENQFFPQSPQTRCLLKINEHFLIFRWSFLPISVTVKLTARKTQWNSVKLIFKYSTFLIVQISVSSYWRATTKLHFTTSLRSYRSILNRKAPVTPTHSPLENPCKCFKSSFQ